MLDWSETSSKKAIHALPQILKQTIEAAEQTGDQTPDQTGLGEIDRAGGRVSVDDKRMIN